MIEYPKYKIGQCVLINWFGVLEPRPIINVDLHNKKYIIGFLEGFGNGSFDIDFKELENY